MNAIKESIAKNGEKSIGMDDIKLIENKIKSSVSMEDVAKLEIFRQKLP